MEKNIIIQNLKNIFMKSKSKKIKEEAEELKNNTIALKEKAEKELKEANEKLEQYNKLIEEAEQEEKLKYDNTLQEIKEVANKNGYFCGVVLTREDILNILNIYMDTKDNVRINASLYLIENVVEPIKEE